MSLKPRSMNPVINNDDEDTSFQNMHDCPILEIVTEDSGDEIDDDRTDECIRSLSRFPFLTPRFDS